MAVVTTAGTPLGTGLIRYIAVGGEPIRDATHYTGLNTPSGTYVAGETVEVLLDAGYSQLNPLTKDHLLGAYRTPSATAVQTNQGSNKSYHLQLEFVTDLATNSDLAAFEALQDAGMQGSTLFWYPDWINYPTEYIPCVIRKRNNPQRNGVVFTIGLDLESIVTSDQEPAAHVVHVFNSSSIMTSSLSGNSTFYTPASSVLRAAAAWIKTPTVTSVSARQWLTDNGALFSIRQNANTGTLEASFNDGTNIGYVRTDGAFDLTAWAHIGLLIDTSGVTPSDRLKLFVNGLEQTSTSILGTVPVTPLPVGLRTYTPFFVSTEAGLVTDAVLFDGVAPDFMALAAALPVDHSTDEGIMHWFRFNGDTTDSSTNNAYLSVNGTPSYSADVHQ